MLALLAIALATAGVLGWQQFRAIDPISPLAPVPLTAYIGYEGRGVLSPDGKHVAFEWDQKPGQSRIYTKLAGAGEPVRLTSAEAFEFNPAWSPDGKQIAFFRSDSPGRVALYVTPALGGHERKVTEFVASWRLEPGRQSALLTWIPDGRRLLFVVPGGAGRSSLTVVDLETGQTKPLFTSSNWFDGAFSDPAFSPDGKTLAFASRRTGKMRSDVYLGNWDSAAQSVRDVRRLTRLELQMSGIAWLPDGRSLVVSAGTGAVMHLYHVRADGRGTPFVLYAAGHTAIHPSISSNGSLLFTRLVSDLNIWELQIPRPAAPQKRIASTEMDSSPQYSPDGSRIAFQSSRSGSLQIWTCAADGSRCIQITNDVKGSYIGSPSWSPDGASIVFDATVGDDFDVFAVNSSGGSPRRLTSERGDDYAPSFSRDGQYIYFVSTREAGAQIWRIPAAGGAAVRITAHGGTNALESPDGEWLYYSKRSSSRGDLATLWRKRLRGGGPEERVLDVLYDREWTIGRSAVWYLTLSGNETQVRRLDLHSGDDRLIGRIPRRSDIGLSVSPDEKSVLYAQEDAPGSDLMLVQEFR